ncbi:MAG: anti-sigma factor RsiW, partial [Roseivirga sp.]
MSYKPTNEELMAYLYDEIEPTLKAQIEAYLKDSPKAKEELEALESTRLIFSDLEDEALPNNIPLLIPQGNSEWLYWRKYVAIAATLLLLITFGWLSGFNVQSYENGFQIAFGEIQNGLTEQQVADLINQD